MLPRKAAVKREFVWLKSGGSRLAVRIVSLVCRSLLASTVETVLTVVLTAPSSPLTSGMARTCSP